VNDTELTLITSERRGLGEEALTVRSMVDCETCKLSDEGDGSWIPRYKPVMLLLVMEMEGETPKLGTSSAELPFTTIEGTVLNEKGIGSRTLAPSKDNRVEARLKAEVPYETGPFMERVELRIEKEPVGKMRECCTPYFKLTVLLSMIPCRSLSMINVRSLNWAALICMRLGVPNE
jgi:hypothetical protein